MRTRITYKNIEEAARGDLQRRLESWAEEHIEPRLEAIAGGALRLDAQVERSRHHQGLIRVALRLRAPRKTLVARADAYDLRAALKEAETDLERQVDRYLTHFKRQDQWKRKERRKHLKALKGQLAAAVPKDRKAFLAAVRPHLARLERVLKRELTYLRASGDLAPDYPSLSDLVDEALVRAYTRLADKPAAMDMEHWLLRQAVEALSAEVAQYRERTREETLEAPLPAGPRALLDEDESIDFWEPEEVLRIEDLAADSETATPEELTAEDQRNRYLYYVALGELPWPWRRALSLVVLEGLSPAEAAACLGVDEARLKTWLEMAEAFVRAKLEQAGFDTGDHLPAAAYAPPREDQDRLTTELAEDLEGMAKGA